jgi:hypothetical protein
MVSFLQFDFILLYLHIVSSMVKNRSADVSDLIL